MRRLALLLLATSVHADPKIEQSIPADTPLTVILVAQCGAAIGLYATMPDGTIKSFDMSSKPSWGEQIEWAQKAPHVLTVETPCHVLPEMLEPPRKT